MTKLFLSVLLILFSAPLYKASAQVQELEQLALDIEKLAQMKSILTDMYKGYQILSSGYNTVKGLAQGNFSLHSTFLNALLTVNPSVKNYVRVADIISDQITLVAEYKTAFSNFTASGLLGPTELSYISNVYSNLFDHSVDNITELAAVITDGQLRMSDAERLSTIDQLYTDTHGQLTFLRNFNNQAGILVSQRQKTQQDINSIQNLYGQP